MQTADIDQLFSQMLDALQRAADTELTSEQIYSYIEFAQTHGYKKTREALAHFISIQEPGGLIPTVRDFEREIEDDRK